MTQNGRRIRFLTDWDWKPSRMATVAYKAGHVAYVTKVCAEKALALGKAEPVKVAGSPPAGIRSSIAKKRAKKDTPDA